MSLSYWQRNVYFQPVDLCIVGAGFTGLWAAYHFLERFPKANVLILEKGQFPSGASIRNAGFACFGSAGELLADLKEMGMDKFLELLNLRVQGLSFLKERVPFKAMDYEDTGGLEMFTDQRAFIEVAERIEYLNQTLSPITNANETFQINSQFDQKSIYSKKEGMIDPAKLIQFLTEQVRARGASFLFGVDVEKVESSELSLKGMQESIRADRILVATNGFTHGIFPFLPVRPARNYVMITKPLEHLPLYCPTHYHQGFVYFRPVGKRLLLGGGRHVSIATEFTNSTETPLLVKEWLINFARKHLKINIENAIEMEWTGTLGISADNFPKIIEIKPKVDWIGGYSGMGVGAAVHLTREWVKGM